MVRKEYSGIIAALGGERHKPEHKQPASLAAGRAIASWITPAHEILFDDFRWFAALLNMQLTDPWAIEELNDTNIRGFEGPEFGRRYQVWYNACKVGTMQVMMSFDGMLKRNNFSENRSARVKLDLDYLRFIPYIDAGSLIYQIVLLVRDFDFTNGDASRAKARATAADALGGYLWEAVREPEFDPSFDFSIDGSCDLLRHVVDDWKKQGIDPMVKWGGDREKA
ncbi:hypothetical protein [Rhizobium sullae]|uniref:hypothetical protein n=1 Tax=Rhizobium sullae TaxID=50338 RepID=UPI000B355C88|nr:hypothetical protein [Rhizobium sullae]